MVSLMSLGVLPKVQFSQYRSNPGELAAGLGRNKGGITELWPETQEWAPGKVLKDKDLSLATERCHGLAMIYPHITTGQWKLSQQYFNIRYQYFPQQVLFQSGKFYFFVRLSEDFCRSRRRKKYYICGFTAIFNVKKNIYIQCRIRDKVGYLQPIYLDQAVVLMSFRCLN